MSLKPKHVGMVWIQKEDYENLKLSLIDGNKIPAAYEQWLDISEATYRSLKSSGYIVEKVYIDPETFPAWCQGVGIDKDTKACTEFAERFVARKYGYS